MASHFPPKISNPLPNLLIGPGAEVNPRADKRSKSLSTPVPRPHVSQLKGVRLKQTETIKRLAEASPAPAPSDEKAAPPRGVIESSDSTPSPEKSPSPQITGSPQLHSGSQKKHLSVKIQASEHHQSKWEEFDKKYAGMWHKKEKVLAAQDKSGGESPELKRLENPSPEPGSSPQLPASPPSRFPLGSRKSYRPGAPAGGASPEGMKLTKNQVYQDKLARAAELGRARLVEMQAKAAADKMLGPDPTEEQQPSEAMSRQFEAKKKRPDRNPPAARGGHQAARNLSFSEGDPRRRIAGTSLGQLGPAVTSYLKRSFQSLKPGGGREKVEKFAARTEQFAPIVKGSYDAETSTCTPIIRDLVVTNDGDLETRNLAIDRFFLAVNPAREGKRFESKSLKEKTHEAFVYFMGFNPDHVTGPQGVGLKFFDDKDVQKKWAEGDMAEACGKATAKIYGKKPINRGPVFLKQHITAMPDRLSKSLNEAVRAAQTCYDAATSHQDTTEADSVFNAKAKSFFETCENEIEALKNLMEVLTEVPKKMTLTADLCFDMVGKYYKAISDYLETPDGILSASRAFAGTDPKEVVSQFKKAGLAATPYMPGSKSESVSDSEAEADAKIKAKVEAEAKARAEEEREEREGVYLDLDTTSSESSSDADS